MLHSVPEAQGANPSTWAGSQSLISPQGSFQVDDFVGSGRTNFDIEVPPARGVSPKLSLNYSSSGGNSWIGLGWDLSIGWVSFIQRRGVRKGVPEYNDYTDDDADVFELNLGGSTQELVFESSNWGIREYRLRIEGAYLRIKYYPQFYGNFWVVRDKSGMKMTFGSASGARIGPVLDPQAEDETFRWYLDRVEDPKTNYMEFSYFKDTEIQQGQVRFLQMYLQEINYNGHAGSPALLPNHKIIFNRTDRTNPADDVYNYRPGFLMKTRKRLSSIEIKTKNDQGNYVLVRKYEMGYQESDTRSRLSSITHYGKEGPPLPPTNYQYQSYNLGFTTKPWTNSPSILYRYATTTCGTGCYGTTTDLIDMNGDGRLDVVKYNATSWNYDPAHDYLIYFNNGSGFNPVVGWHNPSPNNGLGHIRTSDSIGLLTDFIDLNGDGLPDRVIRNTSDYWAVYFNNGDGFGSLVNWRVLGGGSYIRTGDTAGTLTDIIDMNGDGLPDRVVSGAYPYYTFTVYFNNGIDGFQDQGFTWNNPGGSESSRIRSMYIYLYNGMPQYSYVSSEFVDLNGDGLPDLVLGTTNPWRVYFNNGSGFDNVDANWINGADAIHYHNFYNLDPLRPGEYQWGTNRDLIDINGDGLPDRLISGNIYFNNGKGFETSGSYFGDYSRIGDQNGTAVDYIDLNGDGLPDNVNYPNWLFLQNNGPNPDLLSTVENGIGGTIDIEYWPSTVYDNMDENGKQRLPFIVQTVHKYTQKDGRLDGQGQPLHAYTTEYGYEGGRYDSVEAEFRGFEKVTSCQPNCEETQFESKTETTYHQDYFKKGKALRQVIVSTDGHAKQVDNTWLERDTDGGGKFPYLNFTQTMIMDVGAEPYGYYTYYHYDTYLNMDEEHKYGSTNEEEIHTYIEYTDDTTNWILSKPKDITVKNSLGRTVSRKWMDYYPGTDKLWKEVICKSLSSPYTDCTERDDNRDSITEYDYDDYGNIDLIIDPRLYRTTFTYDSTQTHVDETSKCETLDDPCLTDNLHVTTTEYDPGTGNIKTLIPPHLQGTTYIYDPFGRLQQENRPDGGFTHFDYVLDDPVNLNYIWKQEHIANGSSPPEHYSMTHFDGTGRVFWAWDSSGTIENPFSKLIITRTEYDSVGRVQYKSNPFYWVNGVMDPIYDTVFTYDGMSRVTDVQTPDNYHIRTAYQGLKKVVTDQRNHSTAYTYDVHQRLKKVEDANGTITEYSYDPLGNLLQVVAAVGQLEQNTTTMTYDSQSKKRSMSDPDMGSGHYAWDYRYDKSGNLEFQKDAKDQVIGFKSDGLNRLTRKNYWDSCGTYPPDLSCTINHSVVFGYDDLSSEEGGSVPNGKGKLVKVYFEPATGQEDYILRYDLMQRPEKTRKKIGAEEVIIDKSYDSAGRIVELQYFPDDIPPRKKIYSYQYDVAGNLLHLKDNATGTNFVEYSDFTALGQPQWAVFPKSGGVEVRTMYDYIPETGRLHMLGTWKNAPYTIYQNLSYTYDEKGNVTGIEDFVNDIYHDYAPENAPYDALDRLRAAIGIDTVTENTIYNRSYTYDRIGNITYKSDVGTYTYDYGTRPHAVKYVVATDPIYEQLPEINIVYDYDQKPTVVQKKNAQGEWANIEFSYDGNGQRVKKVSPGNTVLYFGDLYEKRIGEQTFKILHLFAGSRRVASIWLDVNENVLFQQFYHPDHLGSTNVVTDQNGNKKERDEYFPFGTYSVVEDNDEDFPNVFHTYTGQEEDDELGLYNYKARLYDPLLGRFISPDPIDPDPEDPQTLNRYAYVLNNPLKYVDPTGFSTWIDDQGFVEDVRFDSDFGIYQSVPFGAEGPPARVGETYFFDSFFSPENHIPVGQVSLGQSIDKYLTDKVIKGLGMSTDMVLFKSQNSYEFDIKEVFPGHEGKSYHGFLFGEKYVTLREAGNILAGLNAATHGLSFEDFQKGAGAYQAGKKIGALAYRLFGKTYGTAPGWGEKEYQRTRSKFGYDLYMNGITGY
jgi:RHS repeat-associated protein